MPIYEYSCRQCESSFEELVLSRAEIVQCPRCSSEDVEKKLSVFSSPGDRAAGAAASCACTPRTCGCH